MRASSALTPVAALSVALVFASPIADAAYNARTNYILHCQGCHGADGVGGTPNEVPPLRDSVGYFLQVEGGREYLAQVPGAAQAPISDAELAALLNYMIERFSPEEAGPGFAPYSTQEVTRVRRLRPDVVATRTRLVEAVRTKLGVDLWVELYAPPGAKR